MRLRALFLGLALGGVACAATPVITPERVAASIEKQGAQAFLASLDETTIDTLLDRIGSGQRAWVALTPRLAPGADGANAEGLGIALAYALPKNATAVLGAVDPIEGDGHILAVSRVCGVPFIDEPPHRYRQDALVAVKAVKEQALQAVKARCLAKLHAS